MKLSNDQKKILKGILAYLVGAIVGPSFFALLGKISWSRALDIFVGMVVGAVAAGLFLLVGSKIPKNKEEEK